MNATIQAVTNGVSERVTINQGRLVAMEAVPAGTFLVQYTGEVIAVEELENRISNLYQTGQPLYLLPLGQTALVDATLKGSIARLGVHSCDPSAEVKPWLVEVKIDAKQFPFPCPKTFFYFPRLVVWSSRCWPCTASSPFLQETQLPMTSHPSWNY